MPKGKKTESKKIRGAEIRCMVRNADEIRANVEVKNFTSSAYVPVPIHWRGHCVTLLRLKKAE